MIEITNSAHRGSTKNGRLRMRPAFAFALSLALLSGCRKEETPAPEITVQAEHPEQGPISEHIVADAILAPLAQAAIAPKISAPVRKFYVQRGAKVKEGDLLA